MIYWRIFWVFLVANFLGYGGGPAIIPLVQHEVVGVHGWLTEAEVSEVLAMGNALPGPIATKMASQIGFSQAGALGATVALIATIAPSLILMIPMMGLLLRHKDSPPVKRLAHYLRPTIAVLLFQITVQNFTSTWTNVGPLHLILLSCATVLAIGKFKVHPALMVLVALVYGALLLG